MIRKIIYTIIGIVFIISFYSCSDAKKAKFGGYGSEFMIEMLDCNGDVSKTWISTGKVSSEQHSDGYYFMEKNTGKLIEVTGHLIITKLNE